MRCDWEKRQEENQKSTRRTRKDTGSEKIKGEPMQHRYSVAAVKLPDFNGYSYARLKVEGTQLPFSPSRTPNAATTVVDWPMLPTGLRAPPRRFVGSRRPWQLRPPAPVGHAVHCSASIHRAANWLVSLGDQKTATGFCIERLFFWPLLHELLDYPVPFTAVSGSAASITQHLLLPARLSLLSSGGTFHIVGPVCCSHQQYQS